MRELFNAYLQNSLYLSAVVLLLMAFSPLLARRYTAKCRYYLGIIVCAALLLPIRPKINVTLPKSLYPFLSQSTGISASGAAVIPNFTNSWNWLLYACLLWVIGALCFFGWHAFQHLRFLSAVKRWSEDIHDPSVLELFEHTKADLGIMDSIAVKSCACIKTPMGVGLIRPMVLLPQISFPADELPLILKHELVHHKRRDLWYKAFLMLTLTVHWFNPMIHFLVRSILNLCEISCDEEVLKGVDAKGRMKYGESILCGIRSGGIYQTALSTNFYSGAKGMKQRIYAMMDMTAKRFSSVLFLAVLILALCGTTALVISPAQTQDIAQPLRAAAIEKIPDGTSSEPKSVQPQKNGSVLRLVPDQERQSIPRNSTGEQNDTSDLPELIVDTES